MAGCEPIEYTGKVEGVFGASAYNPDFMKIISNTGDISYSQSIVHGIRLKVEIKAADGTFKETSIINIRNDCAPLTLTNTLIISAALNQYVLTSLNDNISLLRFAQTNDNMNSCRFFCPVTYHTMDAVTGSLYTSNSILRIDVTDT